MALASHPSGLGPRPQPRTAAASWGPRPLLPADAVIPTARPATGPSLGQVVLSMPIIATTPCADFRCAPDRFVGCTYRPRLLPGTAGWRACGQNAGAQTDLSCSMFGCANVPIPIRRGVPRGCDSKIFTPSMAFAVSGTAQLPLCPAHEREPLRRGRIRLMLRTACSLDPTTGLCRDASTPRISPRAGHQLHGCLVITAAGLPPASRT